MTDRVTVIGNIGQEPLRKTTAKGEVVEFDLAHSPRVQAEDGAWKDGETVWYRVSAWDRLGASAAGVLHRGQRVIVLGRLQEREWTGRDGAVRLSRDLHADAIGQDIRQRGGPGKPAASAPRVPETGAQAPDAPAPSPAPGDWGAPPAVLEPAPAGWSTVTTAEEEPPF